MTTKEKIMQVAMKLFSEEGFDAVSVRRIASEVGIVNSALYKHFKSKMDILKEIIEDAKKRFLNECSTLDLDVQSVEDVKKICFTMFSYNVNDDWIVMFRRLLLIEQYKMPELKAIYKEFFIDQRVKFQSELFKAFMEQGLMKENDPYCLAIELYSPFYMYHLYNMDDELQEHLNKHVENFFNNNLKENNYGKSNVSE